MSGRPGAAPLDTTSVYLPNRPFLYASAYAFAIARVRCSVTAGVVAPAPPAKIKYKSSPFCPRCAASFWISRLTLLRGARNFVEPSSCVTRCVRDDVASLVVATGRDLLAATGRSVLAAVVRDALFGADR